MTGTAGKTGSTYDNDANIHALGKLAQSPFDHLRGASPFCKHRVSAIGQQRSGDIFAVTCRRNSPVLTCIQAAPRQWDIAHAPKQYRRCAP